MSQNKPLGELDLIAVLNGMVDGVITINDKGIIISFNHSAERLFGYTSDEVLGKNVSMLMPEPDRSQHDGYLLRYITSNEPHVIGIGRDVIAIKKGDETFPMRLSVSEYQADADGHKCFIASCQDITLQKQQEEQLAQNQKMQAMSQMTGGICHDFNNTLGVILGFAGLLMMKYKDDPVVMEFAGAIQHAGERGEELTKNLMSFASNNPVKHSVVDINEALRSNLKIIKKMLTSQINVGMYLGEDIWPVSVDIGCFEDAILNLSINAMHAMPEGGKLDFTTTNTYVGSLDSQILHIDKGEYIKLIITDNGIGMSDEVKKRIFEPFFTTKNDKGTGLGLSQVYSFTIRSGGAIKVYSEHGHGTSFSIYLPRSDIEDVPGTNEENSVETEDYSGNESILIVDDEKSLVDVSNHILSMHGYKTFTASGGKEALEMLENNSIDLILSDVIMPEMDGFELAHIIKHTYPDIKILLCSGFIKTKGKTVTDTQLLENILHKPFTANDLLKKVKSLLS